METEIGGMRSEIVREIRVHRAEEVAMAQLKKSHVILSDGLAESKNLLHRFPACRCTEEQEILRLRSENLRFAPVHSTSLRMTPCFF